MDIYKENFPSMRKEVSTEGAGESGEAYVTGQITL